jgi:heterodisulfide reductase subunit B
LKELLLFRGCTTPVHLPTYEAATLAVLKKLGVKVSPLNNANCCGAQYIESLNIRAFYALGARLLALAEVKGKDILTICGACSRSLKHTKKILDNDKKIKREVNNLLKPEGLKYTGNVEVKHFLDVLRDDIGFLKLKKAITIPYPGFRIAAHYGCHIVRPHGIRSVGNTEVPDIIDKIVKIAGGVSVCYDGKYECCGGPLLERNEHIATKIGRKKISSIRTSRAECIVTSCGFCNLQLTQAQFIGRSGKNRIPVLTLPQFLGPALGIQDEALGLKMNRINPSQITELLLELRSDNGIYG